MSSHVRNISAPQGMTGAPVNTEQAQEMKAKIEEALIEVRQARDLDQYMDMADRAELELLEAKLKSTLTLINHFLTTGEWGVPGLNGDGQASYGPNANVLRDANPGWNGDFTQSSQIVPGYEDVHSWVGDGDFEGFIYIDDNGNPQDAPELAFVASPTTIKIEGFNHGSDIVYVETYLDNTGNEQKRFWVGVGHATNVRANILISAHNLQANRLEGIPGVENPSQGVTMDFHRVIRVSDGSGGRKPGEHGYMTFIGSDLIDDITGTQSIDLISGLAGSDTLSGEGGDDKIWGDSGIWNQVDPNTGAQITAEMVRQQLGLRTDLPDGDDTIDGGAHHQGDQLYGDGGVNYGVTTDARSGPDMEVQSGIQHQLSPSGGHPPTSSWFISGQGWDDDPTYNGNIAEIRETDLDDDEQSILTLRVPPNYDYATAENYGERDLRITFVKHVDGQPPKQFVVIVKGAFRDREGHLDAPFTLRLLGNGEPHIIDFSQVKMGNNNFVVDEMDDSDMILAPQNELNSHGWGLDDLLDRGNRISGPELEQNFETSIVPQGHEEGLDIDHNANRTEIVISRGSSDPVGGTRDVNILPTADSDRAYVMVDPYDPDGSDLLVLLVEERAGGDPRVLVIRIEDYRGFVGNDVDVADIGSWLHIGNNFDSPTPGGGSGSDDTEQSGWYGEVIALSSVEVDGEDYVGNVILAGTGDDFVFHGEGDHIEGAESGIEVNFSDPVSTPSSTTETETETEPETEPETET